MRGNSVSVLEIRRLLELFVSGADRSIELAGKLEGALDLKFPEDERFEELVLALASYQPGGGKFLYDAESLLPLCRSALDHLQRLDATE